MSKPEIAARKYFISGRVQGVGYRFFAEREARSLGLRGYVRNLTDGRVEAYAIGDTAALGKFSKQLAWGPGGAAVKKVVELEEPLDEHYTGFWIVS